MVLFSRKNKFFLLVEKKSIAFCEKMNVERESGAFLELRTHCWHQDLHKK